MRKNILSLFQNLFLASLLVGTVIRIPILRGSSVYVHDAMLVLYYIVYIVTQWKQIRFTQMMLRPIGIFLAVGVLSLLVNSARFPFSEVIAGGMYLVRIALYAFLLVPVSLDPKPLEWMKKMYLVGVVFALIGLLQFWWYPNLRNLEYAGWDPHFFRLFSTFLDPNFAGLFLVITFFTGVYLRPHVSKFMSISLSVVLLSILLTLSRSSIIAFIGAGVCYSLDKQSWKWGVALLLFILLIPILPIPNRSVTPLFRYDSSIARLTNWSYSLELIRDRPLLGHGFNLLRSVSESMYSQTTAPLSHAGAGVDNSLLFVLATMGLLGGVSFCLIFYHLWKLVASLVRSHDYHHVGMMAMCTLVGIGIHSMFNNSVFYPWIVLWGMIIIGVSEAHHRKKKVER